MISPKTFTARVAESALMLTLALAIAHTAAAQALDPTFGNGGKVTTDFGGADDFAEPAARARGFPPARWPDWLSRRHP